MNEWKSEIFLEVLCYSSSLRVCSSHLQFQCFAGNYLLPERYHRDILSLFSALFYKSCSVWLAEEKAWQGWCKVGSGCSCFGTLGRARVGCGRMQGAWAVCLCTGWRNPLYVLVCYSVWLLSGGHKTWSDHGFQMWHHACSLGEGIIWVHWDSWIFETVNVLHF